MIHLTGYYQFGVDANELREATTSKNPYANIGARGEANSWHAKINLEGRKFVLPNAAGVLSDKFGFWYVVGFLLDDNMAAFLIVREDSSVRYAFEMKKRKATNEYWGTRTSLDLTPSETITVNCLALEAPEITPNLTGIPERMLVPPPRSGLH